MNHQNFAIINGNESVAQVVYQLNEVIAIYPITPSTPMSEWADAWTAESKPNFWGAVPSVVEMQSEGGVTTQDIIGWFTHCYTSPIENCCKLVNLCIVRVLAAQSFVTE